MHRWPVVPNAPHSTPSSARSRSASSNTIIAFLPPISSDSRLCMRPHVSPTMRPVSVDPVNEMTGIERMVHDRRAGRLAEAVHELNHFGRQSRLEHDLDEHVPGVRNVFGRLEDARVSAEQRREHLPRRNGHRKVERRDDAARRRSDDGSSSPTCCASRSARCGRTGGVLPSRRSTRCRCLPERRRASR